jgi:DNA-binding PadR family transcriptional regulator
MEETGGPRENYYRLTAQGDIAVGRLTAQGGLVVGRPLLSAQNENLAFVL